MAYDDTKITGSTLTADEYNAFVTEMKTRADNATGSGAPSSTPSMVSMIYVDTLNDDIYMSVGTVDSSDWIQVNGGAGSAAWGVITGTLADQTDLQSALDAKVDDSQVLTDVPSGALFTDTVYDDTAIQAEVDANTALAHTQNTDDKIVNVDSSVEILDEAGYGRVNFTVDGTDQLNVVDGSLRPEANDTLSLGVTTRRFSDLFTYDIGLGGVIKVDGQTVAGSDGDLVYLSAADTWSIADASVESTCSEQLGIRLSATEVATYGVYTTTGLTAGSIYYASETAGALTTTAPSTSLSIVRIVGYALSTTELFLVADPTYLEVA